MELLIKKTAALLLVLALCVCPAMTGIGHSAAEGEGAAQAYVPDAGYYADASYSLPTWADSNTYIELPREDADFASGDIMRLPCLTPGEARRAAQLLKEVESGETVYTGASVLNKMTDVSLGVYELDPEDYDGEAMYVILPSRCLTDEMLLALIGAFCQAGRTFDPAGLNERNCMRGGGIETTRFLTEEESERSTEIHLRISRGELNREQAEGANAPLVPALDAYAHCGLEEFTFRPYRSLTDMEIAAKLFSEGAEAFTVGQMDADDAEHQARALIAQAMRMPEGAECVFVTPLQFAEAYSLDSRGEIQRVAVADPAEGCMVGFDWAGEAVFGKLQTMYYLEAGEAVPERIRWFVDYSFLPAWHLETVGEITGDMCADAARIWCADHLTLTGLDALQWTVTGEDIPYLAVECTTVTAQTDEWIIQLMVCQSNLAVCDAELYRRVR